MDKYLNLIEHAADGIAILQDGVFKLVNSAVVRMSGYDKEELLGMPFIRLLTPDCKELLVARYQDRLDGKEVVSNYEAQAVTKDGEVRDIEISAALTDYEGRAADEIIIRDVTERRRVEKELQDSSENFRAIFENLNDVIIRLDKYGKIVEVNGRLKNMFGYEPDEVIGKNFTKFDLFSMKDLPKMVKLFAHGIRGKIVRFTEVEFKRKDGSTFSSEISTGLAKRDNKIEGMIAVVRDVTERKRAEEALQESEQQFRDLFENASDLIQSVTPDGHFLYVNRTWRETLGYTQKELRKLMLFDIIHPDSQAHCMEVFQKLISRESVDRVEATFVTKNGKKIIVEGSANCRFVDGKPVATRGIFRNITERKRAEERLKESEERYRNLVELSPVSIMASDIKGVITSCNPMTTKTTGYSEDEIIGKHYLKIGILRVSDIPRYVKLLASAATGKVTEPVELQCYRKDGTPYWAEVSVTLMKRGSKRVGFLAISTDITERKQTEEALQHQNEFLNTVLESITHPFYVVDANDYTIKIANSAAKAGDLSANSTCYTLTHKRDKPCGHMEHPCPLEEVKKTKKPVAVEHIHYDEDGNSRNVEVHGYPVFDTEGNVIQMVEYCLDITERKRMEEELRKSKEKWRSLTGNTDDTILITDNNDVIQYINKTIPPETPKDVIGKTIYEYVSKEHHDVMRESLKKVYKTGEPDSYEVTLDMSKINPKIGTLWFRTKVVPIKADKEATGVIMVATDITERKRMEHVLNERVKELNCLYGIAEIAERPTITLDEVYPEVANLLPASWQHPYITCARIAINGKEYETENYGDAKWKQSSDIKVYGAKAGEIEVSYLEERLELDEGPFLKEERLLIDAVAERLGRITERMRTEEVLARQSQELARSNEELQQFAYIASHDLQEPLRMVASYTQLLQRRYKAKLDADADEFIAYAVDGANRMRQLINDLLTYSQVRTRSKDFEPTDCQAVFNRAILNLQAVVEESGAVVTHDPMPTVMADASQLGQVFQNLISNALKYRSERPPEVHVGAERKDDEWLFWVRDNGIGIDKKDAERIFVPFQRLHPKGEYSGTGIGLAICRKIVERHGGHIWVESEPGKGATFYFTIPAAGGNRP